MENMKEKLKNVLKQVSFYLIISVSLVAGGFIGYYYEYIKSVNVKEPQVVSIK